MIKNQSSVLLFANIFLLCFLIGQVPAYAFDTAFLPVIVYHHIQSEVKSDVACTPEQFEHQIKAIITAGYTPITLNQTAMFLAGALNKKILKPVLITFDDGYESLYHYALPVAVKYQVPMTVFVVTARIGRRMQFSNYLTASQILEMDASGYWDFGSHSHDLHTDILRIYNAFGEVKNHPVKDLIRRDLNQSANRLAGLLSESPVAIAWPYGKFNHATTRLAREAGFKLHFTSVYGYNEVGSNPFAIRRIPVTARDTAFSVLKKISRIK
jgi:peptidoglycan/xylan/chitin deacetylase (PgdA/CDA1 family)